MVKNNNILFSLKNLTLQMNFAKHRICCNTVLRKFTNIGFSNYDAMNLFAKHAGLDQFSAYVGASCNKNHAYGKYSIQQT
jgi:hypothetical protein